MALNSRGRFVLRKRSTTVFSCSLYRLQALPKAHSTPRDNDSTSLGTPVLDFRVPKILASRQGRVVGPSFVPEVRMFLVLRRLLPWLEPSPRVRGHSYVGQLWNQSPNLSGLVPWVDVVRSEDWMSWNSIIYPWQNSTIHVSLNETYLLVTSKTMDLHPPRRCCLGFYTHVETLTRHFLKTLLLSFSYVMKPIRQSLYCK